MEAKLTPEPQACAPCGLSPMQSGMLFQALLDGTAAPSAGFDLEQMHLVFEEVLDVTLLGRAWSMVAARHTSLASSFQWEGLAEPQQVVNSGVVVPVEEENWEGLSEGRRKHLLEEFLRRDRHRGFDMRVAPLMRVKVFRINDHQSELVWTFHHILLDGRSLTPLFQEIFAIYDALRSGTTPELAAPPRPYSDYIAWLGTLDRDGSRQYFRALLAGKAMPTPLPCAEPLARPLDATGYGEAVHFVDADIIREARATAERIGTTLGTLVHAAWALVLSRYTGDSDVVFGYVRACRRSALDGQGDSIVGLLINTLPVRANLSGDRTVADLLKALREQSVEIRKHEHTPLIDIQRQSEFAPGSPLFETLVMFESQGLCQKLLESGGPRWAKCKIKIHEQPALPFNLTIYAGHEFEVRALFDRRRFETSTVDRLLSALEVALEALSGDASRLLSELDVLSAAERQRILFDWNDTARPFPDNLCIHEPFEAQVARTPNARAVEKDGQYISYRDLEERANRLAHALRARGARPGNYVGICLSRGLDLVVALLGVAKSGAAYVPLDPQYPKERLAFMLSDTKAPIVITEECHRSLFDVPMLVVDAEGAAEVATMSTARPDRLSTPEDECYTIYTSGSTGVPKGVVLCHRAVVNTFDWVMRNFEFVPGDRLLFVTSPCFDLSVWDTFGVLGAGGTVVVASSELLRDPSALASAIVEKGITVWDSAPAALQRLVSFIPESSKSAPLRLVMLSGDWIPVTLPDAMRSAFPNARVMSLGGATEAAIWSNWYPIGKVEPRWTSIPYGRPIQNSRYHVLDGRLRPVPIGAAGDLYIGGTCLANGYLNRVELTRERFIPDPFRPGERLYKTGDLARYFEDGNLEFLGRADFQVKIRGYRVEMGEVEAVLSGLDGVREAVCAAHGDASGQMSLIAYVVPRDGAQLKEEAMKAAVATKLPDFMVPSQIIMLSAMPLSSNGKLDRKALPAPGTFGGTGVLVAPRSDAERQMAQIWEEVLQRKPIGIRDDFFKLGGHSLLAVLLVSRIKVQLGVDVPLSRIMERPTVESLVQSISRGSVVPRSRRHLTALSGSGARPPLFLFPGAGGYSFIYRDLPALLGEDQPVFTLQAIGAEGDGEVANYTIEEMAQIYVREIVSARPDGPFVLAGYSFGVLVAYEVARQLRDLGKSVPLLVSLDGYAPGFPQLQPMPERLVAHVKAFFKADGEARSRYLRLRVENTKRRVLELFGRSHELIEDIPFADEAMNLRMRKLWAHFWQARNRYRPRGVLPCDLLLIRTEVAEEWVGTSKVDSLYGWEQFVSGTTTVVTIPGEHLMLFEAVNQAPIARAIADEIARRAMAP